MIRTSVLAGTAALCLTGPAKAEMTDRQAIGAMIGVLDFSEHHCPELRPNWAAIKEHLAALGLTDADEVTAPDVLRTSAAVSANMGKMPSGVGCSWVWGQFGAGGLAEPDLFIRK